MSNHIGIVVLLRLLTRLRLKNGAEWADLSMFLAWCFTIGNSVAVGMGLYFGTQPFSIERVYKTLKTVFGLELTYYCALYFIKLSILLLYLRLSKYKLLYHTDDKPSPFPARFELDLIS
jgi:hypothetical protein